MHGKKLVGAGALALAMAAGVGGPAQAAHSSVARSEMQTVTRTVEKIGDAITFTCPAGQFASNGFITGSGGVTGTTHYRSEPLPDGSGWVVEVLSTENTAPWSITANAYCATWDAAAVGGETVEVVGTIAKAGDALGAPCPAGMTPYGGYFQGLPPNGDGRYVEGGYGYLEACTWAGGPATIVMAADCRRPWTGE